jgi:methylglyoxal synthase
MKRVVLIAHDGKKEDMVEWVRYNIGSLRACDLYATRATGNELIERLGMDVTLLLHGPMGGDAQVCAMIAEGKVDALIFFWDPLTPQPHDVDVKALLRLAVLYNIPTASNRKSADHLISSPLWVLPEDKSDTD